MKRVDTCKGARKPETPAEGLKNPCVVLWGRLGWPRQGPLYQKLCDEYYFREEYIDCFVYRDGKSLMFTAYTRPEDFSLKDKSLFTVLPLWNYPDNSRPRGAVELCGPQ